MNGPGHVAVGVLFGSRHVGAGDRARAIAVAMPWTVLGAVLPDAVDKSIQALGLSPYGRTIGHSVLVVALVALSAAVIARAAPRAAAVVAWIAAGMTTHLFADLLDDLEAGLRFTGYVYSAWQGWPLTNPDMSNVLVRRVTSPCDRCFTALEIATIALAVARAYQLRGRGREGRGSAR